MENSRYIEINPAVEQALAAGRPVVGVATAFISGGISYPQNAQTAKGAKGIIEGAGCECAFIAVVKGKVKVGLEGGEIEALGRLEGKAEKVTAADLPLAVAREDTGVTTLSAAAAICEKVGIKVLVTDALDGVYGEEKSQDIEALGKTSLMVITSGIRTFMDVRKSAHALEAAGVPTVGVNSTRLAAFYCRESSVSTDTYVGGAEDLVSVLKVMADLKSTGSIVVSNPVPQDSALANTVADHACDTAVSKAAENNIRGREFTPFVMALVSAMTGGMAADAQIAALLSNANLAATVAVRCGGFAPEEEASGGISEEEFEAIKASLDSDIEAKLNQKMQGFGMYMNPYMNPYFAQPQANPYQAGQMPQMPQMQMPQMPPMQMPVMPQAPAAPAPAPVPEYVNPYKPVREETPAPAPEPVPAAPEYKAVPDSEWVNPFAPKHDEPKETPAGGDAPVIARPAEEVMEMVEETVAEEAPAAEVAEEAAPAAEEKEDENAVTEYVPPVREKKSRKAKAEEPKAEEPAEEVPAEEPAAEEAPAEEPAPEEATAEEMPSGGGNGLNLSIPPMPAEAPAEEAAPAAEEKEDENTLTEYVPPVHEKKQRKPDNQEKPQQDEAGMTSYDPEFYKKRAAERKQRIAEAAGEAKHVEEARAAEPDYIECKGPLEFTGEHPWAWKCTKCGQLFQKHEIPHKCVKTD